MATDLGADVGAVRLEADLHTHSVASGHAYSTITEVVTAARDKGLKLVGIADHGPALPGGPHPYYFGNMRVIPQRMFGVQVLKGVEANIVSVEGSLDLPDSTLKRLDFVLAGFHVSTGFDGGSVEENTRAMLGALAHPLVDVAAHPGNPAFQVDIERVVSAAEDLGKLIEINNASLTLTRRNSELNCLDFARIAARLGCRMLVSSDAHMANLVGSFDRALELLRDARVPLGLVVNASCEGVLEFLAGRGKQRIGAAV